MLKSKAQIQEMIMNHIRDIDSLRQISDKEITAELMKAKSVALNSLVELKKD